MAELAKGLRAAGLPAGKESTESLAAEAHDHAVRVGLERENRGRIDALGKDVVELGLVADGIDVGVLYDLAEELGAHGGAGMSATLDLDLLIADPATRIIVTCGAGGVGKTTTAAAIGLRAAEQGRNVVVLTIDPARRLAQALGLTELDNTPREVADVDRSAGGRLDAMMLDMKRTFDDVVLAHASPEKAKQILENPFYVALSSSFAGTQEYMAMEKLGQLHSQADRDGSWDLIVVDTPPSRSALDFLDAPERLASLLEGRFLRLLLAPARGPLRLMSAGVNLTMSVLNKVLGAQVLTDVQTFATAFDTLFGGFRARAEQTVALLREPLTAFVVVAAPQNDALREASYFTDRLRQERMPLAGVVLNRVTTTAAPALSAERSLAAAEQLEERSAEQQARGRADRGGAPAPRRPDAPGRRRAEARQPLQARPSLHPDHLRARPGRRRPRPRRPPHHRHPPRRLTGPPSVFATGNHRARTMVESDRLNLS